MEELPSFDTFTLKLPATWVQSEFFFKCDTPTYLRTKAL